VLPEDGRRIPIGVLYMGIEFLVFYINKYLPFTIML